MKAGDLCVVRKGATLFVPRICKVFGITACDTYVLWMNDDDVHVLGDNYTAQPHAQDVQRAKWYVILHNGVLVSVHYKNTKRVR
jgi:hypothetical protein